MRALFALIALALAPPSAATAASTVSSDGTTIAWVAMADEINTAVIAPGEEGFVRVTDGAGVTPGTGCEVDPVVLGAVRCALAGVAAVTGAAGPMDDNITCRDLLVPCTVNGELGNDTMTGGVGVQNFAGGEGEDSLDGGDGADSLDGGIGNDTLDGGDGGDSLVGNAGEDTADYSARTEGVTVDADGVADDGVAGESDNVATDVERILGGAGADVFLDADGAQIYAGSAGADTVSYAGETVGLVLSIGGGANDGPDGDDIGVDVENLIGGDGDDGLLGSPAGNQLSGGGGSDVLDGGDGADQLAGGGGEDTADYGTRTVGVTVDADGVADDGIAGELDNVATDVERILGGAGADLFHDAEGAQIYAGGAGADTVSYAAETVSLNLSIGGGLNDGPDGDDIGVDIENLIGGAGNDVLTGSSSGNRLVGGAGDDDLRGGDGADVLEGGSNALVGDTLDGGFGPDRMDGGDGGFDEVTYAARTAGVDVTIGGGRVSGNGDDGPLGARDELVRVEFVTGGSGPDRLSGVGGSQGFDGGLGNDRITTRDRDIDLVQCGGGSDVAVIDPNDSIDMASCEVIDRGLPPPDPTPTPPGPTPTPPPPPPPPADPPPSPLAGPTEIEVAPVRRQTLRRVLSRGLRVRVACPRACRATLRLVVSRRTARRRNLESRVIGRGFARLSRASRVTAVVEPRTGVRRRLRSLRRLRVTLVARVIPSGGRATVLRRTITLRRVLS